MKKLLTVLLIGLAGLLTGCASILSDNDYPVTFNAKDGQEYTVKSETGQVMLNGVGTQTATLRAGGGYSCTDYTIQAGCDSTQIQAETDLMVWGNILIGGLIGIVIDGANGSICELPSNAVVPNCE